MTKQLQNKKVVNPQSRGGSTTRKTFLTNSVLTKIIILLLTLGWGRTALSQAVVTDRLQLFSPNPINNIFFYTQGFSQGARIGFESVPDFKIINNANGFMAFGTNSQYFMQLHSQGYLAMGNISAFPFTPLSRLHLHESSVTDNYISLSNNATGVNGGARIGQAGGGTDLRIEQLGTDNIEFWVNGGTQAKVYINEQTGGAPFLGINTNIPLNPPPTYNMHADAFSITWTVGTNLANPYLTVKGGDIETDGNYYGNDIYVISDARLKKDIKELSDWKKMFEIKPYSYRFINRESKISYGFLAQDVQKVFPELTSTWRKGGSVNYIGFIPFLAQGLKEHEERLNTIEQARKNILEAEQEISVITTEIQKLQAENQILNGEVENLNNKVEILESQNENLKGENQEMKDRLTALEEKFNAICNLPCIQNTPAPSSNGFGQTGTLTELPILEQNEPNPFTQETIIRYFLPESSTNAKIEVRNVENKVVGSFPISQFGHGNITISAGTLTAGNYFYSLIINGSTVETLKMVLLR